MPKINKRRGTFIPDSRVKSFIDDAADYFDNRSDTDCRKTTFCISALFRTLKVGKALTGGRHDYVAQKTFFVDFYRRVVGFQLFVYYGIVTPS